MSRAAGAEILESAVDSVYRNGTEWQRICLHSVRSERRQEGLDLMWKEVREKVGRKEPCRAWYPVRFGGWKKKGRRKHRGSLLKRILGSLGF